jgi:hypothetical protein
MKNITLYKNTDHRASAANASAALAALLGVWVLPSQAAQSIGQFPVMINLQNSGGLPNAGLCRSRTSIGTFGTTVIVDCLTGTVVNFTGNASNLPWATVQDNSFRFMLNSYGAVGLPGSLDNYAGVGTITTWRIIKLSNRDYLELMIHW